MWLHCNSVFVVSPAGIVTVNPEEQIEPRLSNVTFTCVTPAGPNNMFMWFHNASVELCQECQTDPSMINVTGK